MMNLSYGNDRNPIVTERLSIPYGLEAPLPKISPEARQNAIESLPQNEVETFPIKRDGDATQEHAR